MSIRQEQETESDSVGKGKDYERKYIDRMGK